MPGKNALAVLADAEAARVGGMIFFSNGFAEAGTEEETGVTRKWLTSRVAGNGDRRPQLPGLVSLKRRFNTELHLHAGRIKTGDISIVTQSGGLMNAFVELGFNRDIGFNYLHSAGNEAVVQTADYLGWLADDPGTGTCRCIRRSNP